MKNFVDYLTESKKTYSFKIGVAGTLPEGFQERMKTALEKYSIESFSTGKKTPIQERPLDFPNLENMEVTYFDVDLNYPTTSQVLEEYLGHSCSVHRSHIIVRNPNEPVEAQQNTQTTETYEPLLTNTELESVSSQNSVGGDRVMDLLKELENARKERDHDPITGIPKGSSTDISDSTNNKSTVGS